VYINIPSICCPTNTCISLPSFCTVLALLIATNHHQTLIIHCTGVQCSLISTPRPQLLPIGSDTSRYWSRKTNHHTAVQPMPCVFCTAARQTPHFRDRPWPTEAEEHAGIVCRVPTFPVSPARPTPMNNAIVKKIPCSFQHFWRLLEDLLRQLGGRGELHLRLTGGEATHGYQIAGI